MALTIIRHHASEWPELPVSPLLQRIYAHRSIRSAEELIHTLDRLPDPATLTGMAAAVALLERALRTQQRIVIVADYDADGATSCALAVKALQAMGAHTVRYVVPNRFDYGYGLTPESVALAAEQQPDVLVTVDNGIASVEGVAAARQRGWQVLITDHHLPGTVLPAADAIVNPNLPNESFPSRHLAGVAVIFYVLSALRRRLRASGWFAEQGIEIPNMGQFLDLVAFGTVADVVQFDQVNRILVEQGLRRIRAGRTCPGILALCEIANRDPARLSAKDIGFALGPRLNAAGRLDEMALGIRCLLSDSMSAARGYAAELNQFNHERRDIEGEMLHHALEQLAEQSSAERPLGLCLYDERWHQGVIGILASRLRERTHRPVIAFAPDKNGQIKGSARSIAGLHIRDVFAAIATAHSGLITTFGGHAMAAGLSLEHSQFEVFQAAFDSEVRRRINSEDLNGVVYSDGELTAEELSLPVAESLSAAGPWGQGFPEPVFDGVFTIVSGRVLQDKHLKLVLNPADSRHIVDGIAFNQAADFGSPQPGQTVRIAYRLEVNEWRGRRSAQLLIEAIIDQDNQSA